MKFYIQQHEFYAGVDLHSNCLHVCVVDAAGEKRLHRNLRTSQLDRLQAELLTFSKTSLVVGCESTFNWYWLADWCQEQRIPFILGHALYMKAIHGGKVKNDAIDSEKIARLLRGGNFPIAYAYPKELRATRDLMRRRSLLVRRRAEFLGHIQIVHYQENLPKPAGNLSYKSNRYGVGATLADPSSRLSVEVDLQLIDALDQQIHQLELHLLRTTKAHIPESFFRLKTIPGAGDILALTMLYEIGSIDRFPTCGDFLSYSRLVKSSHTSNGKKCAATGKSKIGNSYLRWAFGEAALLHKRELATAAQFADKVEKKHGKARALHQLSVKLARAVYYMLKRNTTFDSCIYER